MITNQQKQQFEQDGFLIINDFISQDSCEVLIKRAHELINDFEPHDEKTIFSTHDQQHAKHQYFLDSSDKIHFFFEQHAFNTNGELIKEKSFSINKIGHGLHDVDPIFNSFSRQDNIKNLVSDLQITNPLLAQSMYICKQPHIGGEVNCHQDATYLYVEDQAVIGLWFALQDATIENGCLWAIPGAHKSKLKSRFICDEHQQFRTEIYDDSAWDLNQMMPLEVSSGSLILLHGYTPHMSKANTSAQSRHAYTLHVISGDSHYSDENWLQRKAFPFRGFV